MIGALFSHFASRSGFDPLAADAVEGGGPVNGPPTNGRAVFHISTPGRRLMSSLVRRAFSEPEAAQEPAGNGPATGNLPDSDCWPMEVVNGQFLFHGADIATTRALLSAGKGGSFTA